MTYPTHKILSDLAAIDERLDRLIDDHTLFRGLLGDALERLEARRPDNASVNGQLCQRIRKALKK